MTITIAQDSGTRADQSGWGTASDGEPWVLKNGTGTLSVASNELVCTNPSSTGSNIMIIGDGKITNGDFSTRFSINAGDIAGMMLRYIDINNYIRIQITTGHITLRRVVGGVQQTDIISTASPALTSGTFYRMHTNVNNNVYSTNVWLDGTSEPAGFQAAQTDTGNNFIQPTQYGLYTFIAVIANVVKFDSFLITATPPTVYVSPSGNDSTGDGSVGNPFASLTKADTVVQAGGTVSMQTGTFSIAATLITLSSGTPLARIVWLCSGLPASLTRNGTVKLAGTMNNLDLWQVKGNYNDVFSFDLSGSLVKDGIANYGHHNRYWWNFAHDCGTGLIIGSTGSGFFSYAGVTTIGTNEWAYNEAIRCGQSGSGSFNYHGFYLSTTADVVHDNIANNCAGWGFNISGSSFSAGNSMKIYHNLSFHNVYGGFVCQFTADNNEFKNNISYDNNVIGSGVAGNGFTEQTGGSAPGTHNVYDHNCTFANGFLNYAGLTPTPTNTVIADPQFVNYINDGSGDYHLKPTSPCIDAGITNTVSTQDFEGVTRPQGAGYDIGPYEAVAYWSWDTPGSRVVAPANQNALALSSSVNAANVRVQAITNQSYLGGLVARFSNKANYYSLVACDSSGQYPNTMRLSIMAGGTETLLSSQPIAFTRGTYHILMFTVIGTTLLGYFDGKQIIYVIDSALTGSGLTGLYHGGGASGTTNWYDFGTRALGGDATGKNVYTKVRMTSTDPLVTPRLTDLVASVRSPDIATGNSLPQTQYSYKNTIAASLDDAAKQSDLSWRFDELYKLKMTDRLGQIAPFVIATANQNIDGSSSPKVTRGSPSYRNRQYITGAVDLQVISESKVGDGITQSWPLKYPVDQLLSVTVNGQPQSFGIQGTDTGRMFYYQAGQNTLSLDSSATPPAGSFSVTSIGRVPYRAMAEDTAQQAILAALDNSTGIVEATEDVPGLSAAAADALAQARLDQNARLAVDWSFTTRQSGLDPGQLLPVVVPEYGLNDFQFLITGISSTVKQDKDGNLLYWHNISTTTGPSTGNWARRLQVALLKKG
jgi:hypothetical protein